MGGVVGVADTIERRESPRGVRGEGGGGGACYHWR